MAWTAKKVSWAIGGIGLNSMLKGEGGWDKIIDRWERKGKESDLMQVLNSNDGLGFLWTPSTFVCPVLSFRRSVRTHKVSKEVK